MIYDYVVTKPSLDNNTLTHYGVKGMKWRRSRKKNIVPGTSIPYVDDHSWNAYDRASYEKNQKMIHRWKMDHNNQYRAKNQSEFIKSHRPKRTDIVVGRNLMKKNLTAHAPITSLKKNPKYKDRPTLTPKFVKYKKKR